MPRYDNIQVNTGGVIPNEWNDVDTVAIQSTVDLPKYTILLYDNTNNVYVPANHNQNFDENSNIVILAQDIKSTNTTATVFTKAVLNLNYLYVLNNLNQVVQVNPNNVNLKLHPRFKIAN